MIIGVTTKAGENLTWDEAISRATIDGSLDNYSVETIWEFAQSCKREYIHVSISMLFNEGMRKSLLEYLIDHYTTTGRMYPSLRGTLIHRSREQVRIPGRQVLRELALAAHLPSGIWVEGHPDKYDPHTRTVTDFKTSSAKSSTWPLEFHIGQISGYRWLLEQHGLEVDHCELDYISWYGEKVITVEPWARSGLMEYMERRAKVVRQALDEHIIPDNMYCTERYCRYCGLRDICRANPGQFILSEGVGCKEAMTSQNS